MKHKKLKQYEIYKISTERLTEHIKNKIKVLPLNLTKREALEHGELVKIQSNQLTNKLLDYFKENNIPYSNLSLANVIVNIVVPTDAKRRGEKEYEAIAKKGFILNGKRFVRLFSGSGQIRRNTVTFIREDLYEPIFNSLLCGLTLDDFGDDFNAAKFNAYCGLNMSGCHLLPQELSPNVCIVDDFEEIRPHIIVNHVSEKAVDYITLPNEDYILLDGQQDFLIKDKTAIRKSDGTEFTIHSGIKKIITQEYYDEITDAPPLNSFDGQGLMSPEWAERVSLFLGADFIPSELIIRAPWVKGLLVTIPFHEWFLQHGITAITDSFGTVRQIADIDCIVSKSQFKMHKIYRAKCAPMGINAWDYHCAAMRDNNLLWGITKTNNRVDDDWKALNYQYIQALQLDNGSIEKLCEPTAELLRRLNSGDINEIFDNLTVNTQYYYDDAVIDDDTAEIDDDYKKLFQKVIEANPDFINDTHIRELIFRECSVKMDGAKIGKILTRGNYQFCVSDPIAQLEWIEKNHCGYDIDVVGVVPKGNIYSNYWLNADDKTDEIVLMRSPLIDRNEIAKRNLVQTNEHYFRYLSSGLVYSIHDLTALQQGGCDFDGDIIFSTNEPIIASGCYSYKQAKPLYYTLATTDLVGRITQDNIIQADIRGLNSKVGSISNKSCSLYAMLQNYDDKSDEYSKIYDSVVALGQIVGMEIDRIKTAVAPTFPMEWKALQGSKGQSRNAESIQQTSADELGGIYRHNELVPDTKPYFFRYLYAYINKNIREADRVFNKFCVYTFGKKLDKIIDLCSCGEATEAEMELYQQYKKTYPVIDTDCIVNHICHYFEDFSSSLHKQTIYEGRKMLNEYVSGDNLDAGLLQRTKTIIDSYQRFKRFVAKAANTDYSHSNKDKGKAAYESLRMMRLHYLDLMLDLTDGDWQLVFDYLVVAADGNEDVVWDILENNIVRIIGGR